jgi:hypothetical protein
MSWTNSRAGASMSASKTLSPSDEVVVEATNISVANGQTDKAVSFGGVDVSQVVAVWMHSDQAVTIETNSTNATGGNTISLAANVPLQWCTGAPFSNPLTQDITSTVYITNASGSTATVNLRVVQDGTP